MGSKRLPCTGEENVTLWWQETEHLTCPGWQPIVVMKRMLWDISGTLTVGGLVQPLTQACAHLTEGKMEAQ